MKENKNLPDAAEVTGDVEEIVNPEHTDERIWFSLQKGDIKFEIGLTDVLLCVKFAERIGEIPPLPALWWDAIEALYPHNGDFYSCDEGFDDENEEI